MKLRLYYPIQKPDWGKLSVSQKFGENLVPLYAQLGMKGHNGWDMYADNGFKVYAAHDGTVTYAGLDGSNGYLVVIHTDEQFDYGSAQAFFKTVYGHLMKGGVFVTAGQKVKAGDFIALADTTGATTGAHLHFGLKPVAKGEKDWVWWNVEQQNGYNGAIDPEPYFTGIWAQDVQTLLQKYNALVGALQKWLEYLKTK